MADNPNWMSVLRDDVRLSELSIPGTHQSVSFYGGGGVPRNLVKTQSMALRFQLESGIRVLDIRCAIAGNSFNIYHGNIYQEENFDGILKTVVAFLKAHPRETVLMRVKEENTDDPGRFEEIFRNTYWNDDKYKAHLWNTWEGTPTNPTLGEMRGKIVILQDFARGQCISPLPNPRYGICYNTFDNQDEHEVPGTAALYDKWLKVKKQLDRANKGLEKGLNEDTKFMNYLSGVGTKGTLGVPHPYFVVSGHWDPATGADRVSTEKSARWNPNVFPDFPRLPCFSYGRCIFYEGTNTLTYGAIRTGYYTKRVGIIMTDFPGKGLIERIICINYEKTDALCKRLPPCTGPMCR